MYDYSFAKQMSCHTQLQMLVITGIYFSLVNLYNYEGYCQYVINVLKRIKFQFIS
jgi:hypothetical protein